MGYQRYDFSNLGENETSRLRPHPLNAKIYGCVAPDADLLRSVKEHGIFNPIVINRDKQILSGNRRWLAAKVCGFKKVPVLILLHRGLNLELLSELFLIESNRQRVKTPEQKAREFKELKRIEITFAKERQRKGGKKKVPAHGPEAGESAAKAAAIVGMGANTAKKLEAVVDAADSGSPRAQKALKAVNAGSLSVTQAYQVVAKPKHPEKINEGVTRAKELSKMFKNGEVTRSRQENLFHVMIRDVTPEQVKKLAKAV